jgi:hypothetical protein
MKPSACFAMVVLTCVGSSVSAQVNTDSESPPKAPIYTPEQLFGTSTPPTSSTPPISSNNPISGGTPSQTQPVPVRPNAAGEQPSGPREQPCSANPSASPNSSQFPGVSASQFQRAGVSADAFTRPGVSTEQLSVLLPGSRSDSCPARRDVVLYPEPVRQPRPIVSAAGEP